MTAVSTEPQLPPSMLERATLILDAFDHPARRLTLGQVALRTRLPRSTAHRILDQLAALDWVARTDVGYALGNRSRAWASPSGGHARIREAAAPVLHELLMRTGGVVHLGVLDSGVPAGVVLLDKLGGRTAAAVPTRVGGRTAASGSALGRALLAGLAPEEVDRRAGVPADALPELHLQLSGVRRSDVSRSTDEYGAGVVAAAVAISDEAALELVLPRDALGQREVSLVLHCAGRVRAGLG